MIMVLSVLSYWISNTGSDKKDLAVTLDSNPEPEPPCGPPANNTCPSPLVCLHESMTRKPVPVLQNPEDWNPVYTFEVSVMSAETFIMPVEIEAFNVYGTKMNLGNAWTILTQHDGKPTSRDRDDLSPLFNGDKINESYIYWATTTEWCTTTCGIITGIRNNHGIITGTSGTRLFSITSPESTGTQQIDRQVGRFEITWTEESRRCGFKIWRNDVAVYEDVVGTLPIDRTPLITKIYDLPLPYGIVEWRNSNYNLKPAGRAESPLIGDTLRSFIYVWS